MKQIFYALPIFLLLSCGGNNNAQEEESNEPDLYADDNEWIVSTKELKEKLGVLQASFTELATKDIAETVCSESAIVPYKGNQSEMNIWLMSNYMLDNFSKEEFGKHDFGMPADKIKNETPLTEFDWLNLSSSDQNMFDIYREYPDLVEIPRRYKNQDGITFLNDDMVEKTDMVLKAIRDGLFGVVAIVDYLAPSYISDTEFETGYIMGYVMFADWETGQLSCMSPFVAVNSLEIDYTYSAEGTTDNKYSNEVMAMNADLHVQTYKAIDSVARARTGFEGKIWVNNSANLENYKD